MLEHPVLLGFVAGVVAHLERLESLKRHALLTEQSANALMADVVDHPSATTNSASLDKFHVENRRSGRDPSAGTA